MLIKVLYTVVNHVAFMVIQTIGVMLRNVALDPVETILSTDSRKNRARMARTVLALSTPLKVRSS